MIGLGKLGTARDAGIVVVLSVGGKGTRKPGAEGSKESRHIRKVTNKVIRNMVWSWKIRVSRDINEWEENLISVKSAEKSSEMSTR